MLAPSKKTWLVSRVFKGYSKSLKFSNATVIGLEEKEGKKEDVGRYLPIGWLSKEKRPKVIIRLLIVPSRCIPKSRGACNTEYIHEVGVLTSNTIISILQVTPK